MGRRLSGNISLTVGSAISISRRDENPRGGRTWLIQIEAEMCRAISVMVVYQNGARIENGPAYRSMGCSGISDGVTLPVAESQATVP
jgi:hypothetical protein